jgi:hypothetical protein
MEKKPLPPGFQSRRIQPVDLPDPSSFRQLRPAILGTPPVSVNTRLYERKRLIVGLGIAVAFHLSLGLAWWLMPPLRLKAGIDPRRWVQVVSVPPREVPLSERPAQLPAAPTGSEPAASPVPALRAPQKSGGSQSIPQLHQPPAADHPT